MTSKKKYFDNSIKSRIDISIKYLNIFNMQFIKNKVGGNKYGSKNYQIKS